MGAWYCRYRKMLVRFPIIITTSSKSGGTPIAYHFGTKYPFGYGLSYIQFEYSELTIQQDRVNIDDGSVVLSLKLENSGSREGCEVVQVYVRDVQASLGSAG